MFKKLVLTFILFASGSILANATDQFYFLRYREHSTDCKSITDGGYYDVCRQLSDDNWYACRPSSGGVNGKCTTPGEWKQIVSGSGINLWQATPSGDMRSSDLNANVGIGTATPMHRVDVNGVINSNADITVNGDPVCRLSQANCPTPIFFNPNQYGNVSSWGNGNAYDWTFNSGVINPILSFSSGLVELKQAGFKVYGTTSGMTFGNHMFVRGTNPREMLWGSTGGTQNMDLIWNNDIKLNKWWVYSNSGTVAVDFDLIGLQNTSTLNNMGAVSIGTSGTGASIATITGNVSIGTANFNKVAPANGMIVQGNVGIGTATPNGLLVVGNCSAQSGKGTCFGTGGCLGYCTAGTWPSCSSCTCCQ